MAGLRTRLARSASLAAPDVAHPATVDVPLGEDVERGSETGIATAGAGGLASSPAVALDEPAVVAETRRRLDALHAELLTDDLRRAVISAARAVHRRAGYDTARTLLAADVIAHLEADSWQAAARARADLDGLDRLADDLPAQTVPEDVAMTALADAVAQLRQRASISVRTPSFAIEDALWRQMPIGWRSDMERPRPASLASDRRAVALVEEMKAAGRAIASSLDSVAGSMQAPRVDVLALLETCSAVADQISALAERASEVDAEVLNADATRSLHGATWTAPAGWQPHVAVPARTSVV